MDDSSNAADAGTGTPAAGTAHADVGPAPAPHGVAVRFVPADSAGLWGDVIDLGDGRLAMTIGRSEDPAIAATLRVATGTVLRETGDPAAALAAAAPGSAATSALCAVIHRSAAMLRYSSSGDVRPVILAQNGARTILEGPGGQSSPAALPPAATVLLCSAAVADAADALDECADLHPDRAADRIIATLAQPSVPVAVVVYRQAPGVLQLTVPAAPANLAPVRGRLRGWLALAGVDPEIAADTLLAVGEAASNATEHSVVGAEHRVELTVSAAVADDRLRFTVSDNGCWKPPSEFTGHRGHGIRLINALVDDVNLVTDERGTTVEMVVAIGAENEQGNAHMTEQRR